MPDHLDGQLAPIAALAAVATCTERVGLSMFVLANDLRHPAVVAKELTTLDLLSDGRLEVGLGAGWMESEYRANGVSFEPPGVRIERLAEAVDVLRGLFGTTPFSHHGRHYRIEANSLHPRPVRPSGIPFVLGGGGRTMLSLAARQADTVSIATNNSTRTSERGHHTRLSRASIAEQVGWIRSAAGDRFASLELNVRVMGVAIGGDPHEGAGRLARELGCEAPDLVDSPFVWVGSAAHVAERIARDRDELGISYFTLSQRHATQAGAIVAEHTGS